MGQSMVIGWECLNKLFASHLFTDVDNFIKQQRTIKLIFPPPSKVFAALELSSFKTTKVIILGQDPYHQIQQATGLSFAVANNIKTPPSLKNIFLEMQNDVKVIPKNNDLTELAKQGVLLLNTTLTVQHNRPNSHANCGWEILTDAIIEILSKQKQHLVFLLWGRYAQKKSKLIAPNKHLILTAAHPSPFSAYRGFFGCKHFSKTNHYLIKNKLSPIIWGRTRAE